jgi:hypothetical protein
MRASSMLITTCALFLSAQPAWCGVGTDLVGLCLKTNGDGAAFKAAAVQLGMVSTRVPADYENAEMNSIAFRRPGAKPDDVVIFSLPKTQIPFQGVEVHAAICAMAVTGNSEAVSADISSQLSPAGKTADNTDIWFASMDNGKLNPGLNVADADEFLEIAKTRTAFRVEKKDFGDTMGVLVFILSPPRQ